jgi:Iap family predicted aminopeptidase
MQLETDLTGKLLIALPGIGDTRFERSVILLCAHYDHLGEQGEGYYPGADDNASGVATLLEVVVARTAE